MCVSIPLSLFYFCETRRLNFNFTYQNLITVMAEKKIISGSLLANSVSAVTICTFYSNCLLLLYFPDSVNAKAAHCLRLALLSPKWHRQDSGKLEGVYLGGKTVH